MPEPSRHHDALDRAASSEALERWRLPLMLLVGVLLYGGARFEDTRPYEAIVIALGFPVLAAFRGAQPLCSGHPMVRTAAILTTSLLGVCAELLLVPRFFPWWRIGGTTALLLTLTLLLAGVMASAVEGLGVRHGMRSRFGAWAGMVVALALYLSKHPLGPHQDPFGSVVAAGVLSVFTGGGLGLLCGMLSTRLLRRDGGTGGVKAA
ncbi:MAG: hypothetical protein JW940_25070 [Polyangiaceae bacterium]|nr:hypothetical protein [Polyangiaceae bacterium]